MAAWLKLRVRALYLSSAIVLFISFLAFNEINMLRVMRRSQNSAPPRLHHVNDCQGSPWPNSIGVTTLIMVDCDGVASWLQVATLNPRDFKRIPGLSVIQL